MKNYFTIGLFILSFVVTPNLVSAQSTADLVAQINSLLATIKSLQAQLVTLQQGQNTAIKPAELIGPPEEVGNACIEFRNNLYLGLRDAETGGEVSKLQQFLKSQGDFVYPTITGFYGPATEGAVKLFQSRLGIVSKGFAETTGYGVVGPQTARKISELTCPTNTNTSTSFTNISVPSVNPSTNVVIAPPLNIVNTSVANTAPAPLVKVTSPQGGESYKIGGSIVLNWSTSNLPSSANGMGASLVKIENNTETAFFGLTISTPTDSGALQNDGSETLVMPDFGSSLQSGTYKVRLSAQCSIRSECFGIYGDSGLFTITESTPSITIFSPNGGEVFHTGDVVQVKWSTTNFGSLNVWLNLGDKDGNGIPGTVAANIPNTGSYSWTIPNDIVSPGTEGAFRILASSFDHGPSAQDISDTSFTIKSNITSSENARIVLDANSDGNITAIEAIKAFRAISGLIPSQKGDVKYNEAYDPNRNGLIVSDDYLTFSSVVDTQLSSIELARVRAFLTADSNRDYVLTQTEATEAINKVTSLIVSLKGDVKYNEAYDPNRNGLIAADDSLIFVYISQNFQEAPAPNQTINLESGKDYYFKGPIAFSKLSDGGFVASPSGFSMIDQVLFFEGNPPSSIESVSEVYYLKQDGWHKVGVAPVIAPETQTSTYFIVRKREGYTDTTLTIPAEITYYGSTVINGTPLW